MTEYANVIKTTGKDKVTVRIERREACKGCNACGMFGSHLDLVVENTVSSKVGDTVELEIKIAPERTFAVIVYLIPLLFMAAGLGIGVLAKLHELFIVLIAVVALVAGFVAAYFTDKNLVKRKNLNPVITKIIQKNEVQA